METLRELFTDLAEYESSAYKIAMKRFKGKNQGTWRYSKAQAARKRLLYKINLIEWWP